MREKGTRWELNEAATHFLNVDLDVWSRRSLKPLVEAFGDRVSLMYEGWEGTRYGAHLEVSPMISRDGAEARIRQFIVMVKRLPADVRRHWDLAQRREFNIGLKGGFQPHSYELKLDRSTLRAAAAIDAGVVITVYATGRHFFGGPGEAPWEDLPEGSYVGPSPREARKMIRAAARTSASGKQPAKGRAEGGK